MPFGGHQQICRSRFLSHLPFFHLLPTRLYERILRARKEDEGCVRELLNIKKTKCPIELFERTMRKEGFEAIDKEMEANGGGNALVVSHGMTIGTIVYLINGMHPHGLDNGSVTILEYEDGQFSVQIVGDSSYREIGRAQLDEQDSSEQ